MLLLKQGLFESHCYHSSRLAGQDSLPGLFPQRAASAPRWGAEFAHKGCGVTKLTLIG